MPGKKTPIIMLITTLFILGPAFGAARLSSPKSGLADNWNDFLHYTKIGRLDLAKAYAQAILDSNPDSLELLDLSQQNPQGYEFLLKVRNNNSADAELAELARRILSTIEQGRFIRRSDPKIIVEEIQRLSSTPRGQLLAIQRLQDAGEYAIPYMISAMSDPARSEEFTNIAMALGKMGRPAIRPLVAALQAKNVRVGMEIIRALGGIGYPQSLAHLKYMMEKSDSAQLSNLAKESIEKIDPAAAGTSAAELFYALADRYYYHSQALAPADDADLANIWFWDEESQQLVSEQVDKGYFNELMAMRCCEWALKADEGFGPAIGLWIAAFFKVESTGLEMPKYFAPQHTTAEVYATTAGPEYLHQALARAIKDGSADVALGVVEALATTAGEKSLFYAVGTVQPLIQALSFTPDLIGGRAVRYSAAIAIALAGPREKFNGSSLVVDNLAQALGQRGELVSAEQAVAGQASESTVSWSPEMANSYALRACDAMLKLAQSRNTAIDLSRAQNALIDATNDNRPEIQNLTGQILAYLNSPEAQRAIAAMAMNGDNEPQVRLSAFASLANSAKLNACMLPDDVIDQIYALINSEQAGPELRSAAAAAYGALNLPSRKVKDLILDQAKS